MAKKNSNDNIVTMGYEITHKTSFLNEKYGITPELSSRMGNLYNQAHDKKNKNIINELTDLILKFPKAAILKNFLSVAYNTKGNLAKAQEINNWILAEHPEYLYGKINHARYYLERNDLEKVEEIMGKEMEITFLYPDRNLFHISEVTCFLSFAISYFIAKDDIEAIEIRFDMLKELAPDHPDTEVASTNLMEYLMKKTQKRIEEEQEDFFEVVVNRHPPSNNKTKQPVFNHPIVSELYKYDCEINQSILKEILALPHETLVADLETLLQDSVNRYHYIVDNEDEETVIYFPIHALMLLAELKSEKSLPLILDVLSYDYDFLDFWFGEFTTESLWIVFYRLIENNLDTLKTFLVTPGIDTYVKSAVSSTFLQLFYHQKITKDELSVIYQEIFKAFLNADLNGNLIDSDLLSFMISDTVDMGLTELKLIIKQLFAKNYVNEGIGGNYQDIVYDFANKLQNEEKKEVSTIFEYYDELMEVWPRNEERTKILKQKPPIPKDDEFARTLAQFASQTTPLVSNKVGRNDPCPCGSGKKYKKCCME